MKKYEPRGFPWKIRIILLCADGCTIWNLDIWCPMEWAVRWRWSYSFKYCITPKTKKIKKRSKNGVAEYNLNYCAANLLSTWHAQTVSGTHCSIITLLRIFYYRMFGEIKLYSIYYWENCCWGEWNGEVRLYAAYCWFDLKRRRLALSHYLQWIKSVFRAPAEKERSTSNVVR